MSKVKEVPPVIEVGNNKKYRYDWIKRGMVKHDPELFRKMVIQVLSDRKGAKKS